MVWDNPPIRFQRKLNWNGLSGVTQLINSRTGLSSGLLDHSHMHMILLSSHQCMSKLDNHWCDQSWNIRLRCLESGMTVYGEGTVSTRQWVLLTTPILPVEVWHSGPVSYMIPSIYRAKKYSWLALNLASRLFLIWVPPAARVWATTSRTSHAAELWELMKTREEEAVVSKVTKAVGR